MLSRDFQTAEEAIAGASDAYGYPIGYGASFICPHPSCGVYADHQWGKVVDLQVRPTSSSYTSREIAPGTKLFVALCAACFEEVVFLDGKMIAPSSGQAPAPNTDMPPEIIEDYIEAGKVLPLSPRGAAALLRLVVQKLLPIIGAKEGDINRMIGELVAKGTIGPAIQQALDSVRVIGNEAVHPGVMDLKDDFQTATSLFKLVNFIVEKAISEPKAVAEIFAGLPANKLAGIVDRDNSKP